MEATCLTETLVTTYKATRLHNPEDHSRKCDRCGKLRTPYRLSKSLSTWIISSFYFLHVYVPQPGTKDMEELSRSRRISRAEEGQENGVDCEEKIN
jgi:hypothetical protein